MPNLTSAVVISSYNYAQFIGKTIESVLRQSHPPDEVIVVDDGSTDESPRIIESFGPAVKLIVQTNQGVCAARNNGARESTSDVIAFMDSDDLWRANKLELQIAEFERDGDVGLVSCGIRYFDEKDNTLVVYDKGMSGWRAREILLYREPVLNTTASAIAIRRKVFNEIGGFDETRELFSAEDREFCYRAAVASKIAFIPEVLVDYRIHGSNGHLDIARMDKALRVAYAKIFSSADSDILGIRRESYGNLFTNLAGSHFRAGNFYRFAVNSIKSIVLTPSSIRHFISFPLRKLKRE